MQRWQIQADTGTFSGHRHMHCTQRGSVGARKGGGEDVGRTDSSAAACGSGACTEPKLHKKPRAEPRAHTLGHNVLQLDISANVREKTNRNVRGCLRHALRHGESHGRLPHSFMTHES